MMDGGIAGSRVPIIKEMLNGGARICDIKKEVDVSYRYISRIKSCLKNDLPTNFHQKKFRSCNLQKRNEERKKNYAKGAKHNHRSCNIYLEIEIKLILKSKKTDRELAQLLGRSVQAIQVKRTKIKKSPLFQNFK